MKKRFLLTPGPTPVPPEVAQKEALPILHHRTSEFGEIFTGVIEGLKYVFQTKNDMFILTSSGTGAMETAVVNLVSRGDEVITATCGKFGERWNELCGAYGAKIVKIEEEWGKCVPPEKVERALKDNPNAKAVFIQHAETSTGALNDIKVIGAIVARTGAVLVVDSISGLAGEELKADEWNLDVVVSGSQKGLMLGPGLSFISVSPKAWALVEKSTSPRYYFDLRAYKKSIPTKETPYTPAITLITALHEALRMIREDGLDTVFARAKRLATACRAGVKALGLEFYPDEACMCNVLTSVKVPPNIDGAKIVTTMRKQYGISIAGGQGKLKGKIIRIAHMGYIDQFDLLVGLAGLELVLSQMGYKVEFGKSVAAAQNALK
jgi:serine---pyruvate transaminase